jgi:hypothetical protein
VTKSTDYTVDQQIARVPAEVRPLVEAARQAVRTAAPHATEIAYQSNQPPNPITMWKLARYTVGGESVIGIGTFRRHSTLFFQHGVELEDPAGLLEGGGKDARSVTLRSVADAGRPEVAELIRRAAGGR